MTLNDRIPFNRGRFCCCGSAPNSLTVVTGDPGLGDWKFVCELPGVEGAPVCGLIPPVGLSNCSRTMLSIPSNSSWINVKNFCTCCCNTLCWCRIMSDIVFTANVAFSSLSVRTICINSSTVSAAYGSKGSLGDDAVGSRWNTSRMQCRSFLHR